MKNIFSDFASTIRRLDRRTIQLMILVITLLLFVLIAGAPDGGGGACIGC